MIFNVSSSIFLHIPHARLKARSRPAHKVGSVPFGQFRFVSEQKTVGAHPKDYSLARLASCKLGAMHFGIAPLTRSVFSPPFCQCGKHRLSTPYEITSITPMVGQIRENRKIPSRHGALGWHPHPWIGLEYVLNVSPEGFGVIFFGRAALEADTGGLFDFVEYKSLDAL